MATAANFSLGANDAVNFLAAARIFLFGARDVWFVVGLPVFLYVNGWSFIEVGGMTGCLVGSTAMLALCWLITLLLPTRIGESVMANQPA